MLVNARERKTSALLSHTHPRFEYFRGLNQNPLKISLIRTATFGVVTTSSRITRTKTRPPISARAPGTRNMAAGDSCSCVATRMPMIGPM